VLVSIHFFGDLMTTERMDEFPCSKIFLFRSNQINQQTIDERAIKLPNCSKHINQQTMDEEQ